MIKLMGLLAFVLLLGGCVAAPPALMALGYIKTGADVVSYVTTKKSTTDHAISAYMNKDCALHRVVLDENMCKLTQAQILEQIAEEYESDGLTAY